MLWCISLQLQKAGSDWEARAYMQEWHTVHYGWRMSTRQYIPQVVTLVSVAAYNTKQKNSIPLLFIVLESSTNISSYSFQTISIQLALIQQHSNLDCFPSSNNFKKKKKLSNYVSFNSQQSGLSLAEVLMFSLILSKILCVHILSKCFKATNIYEIKSFSVSFCYTHLLLESLSQTFATTDNVTLKHHTSIILDYIIFVLRCVINVNVFMK
jgi:hypothetical protein